MAFPVIMPRQGQSVEGCVIAKWFKKKGDAVQIGAPLFSEDISALTPREPAMSAENTAVGFTISPRARNLARRIGVDYRFAEGSGPRGRIIERDIEALKASGSRITSAIRDIVGSARPQGLGSAAGLHPQTSPRRL